MTTRIRPISFLIAAALLAAGVGTALAALDGRSHARTSSPNLVRNPSFERSLVGWRGTGGTLQRVRLRRAPAGKHVARLTRGRSSTLVLDDSAPAVSTVRSGDTLRASALVRAGNAGAVGARASIRLIQPASRSGGSRASARTSLTRNFQRIGVALTARRTGPVELRVRIEGAGPGDAFDLDRITVLSGRSGPGKTPTDPAAVPPAGPRGSAEVAPYDPSFAFNQPIPAGVPSDPRSTAIVAQLDENSSIVPFSLASRLNTPPIYVAGPGDPFYSVTVGNLRTRFRVPEGAVVGGGSDSPLVIMDPSHPDLGRETELRLWQADIGDGRINASGKGLFHYNNDGARLNPDGSRSVAVPFAGAGVGGGLSITAGLVRPEDFASGEIRHALRFAYSSNDFVSGTRAPATKSDQGSDPRDAASGMVMGMRLQLDPAVQCEARTVPTETTPGPQTQMLRMICRALQRYGMIVMDGTADRKVVLMMESSETADWPSILGPERQEAYSWLVRDASTASDGLSRTASSGIPWDRLRVLARSTFS